MRMINKNRTLRTVGVLLCCALLATTFQVEKSDAPVSIPVSAKSVEELRTEKEQNAAKIAEKQKIVINLRHLMDFGEGKFKIKVLNTGKIVKNMGGLVLEAGEFV